MTTYSGMCIGGPMDGIAFCHNTKHFEVEIFDEKRLSFDMKESVTNGWYETYEYKYLVGIRGNFEMNFWANEKEFPTVETILSHVFSEYCARERSK